MSDTYIIEVGSQQAGIVVRAPGGYQFFAASHRFSRLEGQIFRNARGRVLALHDWFAASSEPKSGLVSADCHILHLLDCFCGK